MSIRTIPGKRWTDQREPGEDGTYAGLALTAFPRAVIEPETVGIRELVEADAAAILATAPIGISSNFVKNGSEAIAAGATLELSDKKNVIGGLTSMVVVFAQADPQVIFSGYIVIEPTSDGSDPIPRLVIRAHNISNSSRTVLDTTNIQFICLLSEPTPQPTSPNAELLITPKRDWDGLIPIDVTGLNLTANPTAAIKANSIGQVELNSTDIQVLASRYAGLRGTFTVVSLTAVPAFTNVTLGTSTITGAIIGKPVLIAQPNGRSNPLYTGYVSGADTISVHARANGFGATSVPAGTVLNIRVLQ